MKNAVLVLNNFELKEILVSEQFILFLPIFEMNSYVSELAIKVTDKYGKKQVIKLSNFFQSTATSDHFNSTQCILSNAIL